jgi:aryl-alcohol dehydrogenase-like predicted oxidoreductase
VADELHARAAEESTTPAALAIAFALSNPDVATVLFGATTPDQVRENVCAVDLVS